MPETQPYLYFEDVNLGLLRLWGERSGMDVLDAGCGFATTTKFIQERGNRVTGIDSSAAALEKASQRIGRVLHADVADEEGVRARLGNEQFDVIIFADVLEHLPWPQTVLRSYLRYLREGGRVIVSLPNIGLWSVRLSMMAGRFEYADTGVLDRTHLRFFTRRTARALLESAGLQTMRTVYNPGIVRPFVPLAKKLLTRGTAAKDPGAILDSKPYKLYLETVHPIENAVARMWPGLLAFQMISEARLKESI